MSRLISIMMMLATLLIVTACGDDGGDNSTDNNDTNSDNSGDNTTVTMTYASGVVTDAVTGDVEIYSYDETGEKMVVLDGSMDAGEAIETVSAIYVIDAVDNIYQRIEYQNALPVSMYDQTTNQTLHFSNFEYLSIYTDTEYFSGYKVDVSVVDEDSGNEVYSYEYRFNRDTDNHYYFAFFDAATNWYISSIPALYAISASSSTDLTSAQITGLKAAGWGAGVSAGVVSCVIAEGAAAGAEAIPCASLAQAALNGPCSDGSCFSDSIGGYCDTVFAYGWTASTSSCMTSSTQPSSLETCAGEIVQGHIASFTAAPGASCAAQDPDNPISAYTSTTCYCTGTTATKPFAKGSESLPTALGL